MVNNKGIDDENLERDEEVEEPEINEETYQNDTEVEELTLKLTRMQADYTNLKRRSEIEKKGSIDFGIETLACQILPVLDNFDRAMEAESDKESSFYQGINMIYLQLIEILNNAGIKEIDALNSAFDPNLHNAIMVEESSEHEEGIVIGVLQKGYQFKDKVIRPSMVMVSKWFF